MVYRVGLLDYDRAYQNALMNYCNLRSSACIQLVVFSEQEKLEQFLATNVLNLLLVGDEFSYFQANCPVVVLTKYREHTNASQYLFRYQNMEHLLSGIFSFIGGHSLQEIQSCVCFAVYSPLGRCGKTTYAKWLCSQYTRSLYVNWEGFYDAQSDKKTGSYMLYCMKSRNEACFSVFEEQSVTEIGEPESIFDIRQVDAEDLRWFLDGLLKRKCYDCIVFDIGISVCSGFRIIDEFDRVLIPTLPDDISQRKLKDFERMLMQELGETGLGKVQYVDLTQVFSG